MKTLIHILFSILFSPIIYGQTADIAQAFYLELGKASEIDIPPYFPGCDDIADKEEKRKCSERKMSIYVNTRMKYPSKAREKGTSGIVKVQFKINQLGMVEDVKILEDIGDGCGEAVANAILSINSLPQPFSPAYHRGSSIDVYYNFPISFNIEGGKKKK